MTSTFKVGTDGCGARFAFPGLLGCVNLSAVSTSTFALYSNDLLSEALLA